MKDLDNFLDLLETHITTSYLLLYSSIDFLKIEKIERENKVQVIFVAFARFFYYR